MPTYLNNTNSNGNRFMKKNDDKASYLTFFLQTGRVGGVVVAGRL